MISANMLLPRDHLTRTLARSIAAVPLTIVAAPVGYGKTVVAKTLADRLDCTVLYFAVPVGLSDDAEVWNAFLAAIEKQDAGIGGAFRRLAFPPTAQPLPRLVESLSQSEKPVVLAIDDYHHMQKPEADAFFEQLAATDRPELRAILFSRTWRGCG